MFWFALFLLSGAVIATVTLSKRIEERRKRPVLVLRAISKGDERVREYHHKALHLYSLSKERAEFWVKKQLPLRAKSLWYRSLSKMEETVLEYMGDIRNSRLLKRDEGISEFFKNISEIEKGTGEINETLPAEEPIEPQPVSIQEEIITVPEPTPELVSIIEEITETIQEIPVETGQQKQRRAPKKKTEPAMQAAPVSEEPSVIPAKPSQKKRKVKVIEVL